MKFVQLAKSLKEGLSPVYLIEGEETYFRDSAVDMIRRACGIGNPMLNDARYEGDALKGEAIASLVRALGTLPFLDERRLVRACEFYPTEKEWDTLLGVADGMTSSAVLPCTACRYCTTHCPKHLDIPALIKLYDEHRFTGGGFIAPMVVGTLPEEKRPSACIGCRSCEKVCPQQIKISEVMKDFSERLKG